MSKTVWEAPEEIKSLIETIKENHHPFLVNANIWVLLSDCKHIKNNKFVPVQALKCSSTEYFKTHNDFKIIISAEGWNKLTDSQRVVFLDEALCHCSVKRIPETIVENNKKITIKDDLGRIIYTDEIDYDKENRPKWKIEKPDAEIYFALIQRYGEYSDDLKNTIRSTKGEPLVLPIKSE